MQMSAIELCRLLGGTLEGNPDVLVHDLAKIEDATAGDVSFIANPRYLPYAHTTGASVLVVNNNFEAQQPIQATLIRVPDAYAAFTQLLQLAAAQNKPQGVEQPCFIHPTAKIGNHVYIGAFAYVAEGAHIQDHALIYPQTYVGRGVRVGEGSVLFAGVKVYDGCRIGKNCILHSGVVIGADGFGFASQPDGTYQKIPQNGIVVVEDAVEIGANTCIDRATMGATTIKTGVKLDNLIQIAHNVEVAEHTVIAAQAGISGSAKVGRYCMIGGQAGLVGHISLAAKTKVNAQSGITKSVTAEGQFVSGSPAFEYRNQMRAYALFKQLPSLEARLKALEHEFKK